METLLLRSQKLKPWLIGLGAIATLGTGGALFFTLHNKPPEIDLAKETIEVKATDLTLQIKSNGVVQPVRKSNLSPKESGRLVQLLVKEGDRVEAGQLIARMDDQQVQAQVNQYQAAVAKAKADLLQKQEGERPELISEAQAKVGSQEAAVRSAQAKLTRASEELRRNQGLADSGAISRNALEEFISKEREAQANLEAEAARLREQQEGLRRLQNGTRPGDIAQSEADVAQAAAQLRANETLLDNTLIRAPFAGIITRRYADVGNSSF
jgi:HlyD family secretion protein